jgi:hypothetical protein
MLSCFCRFAGTVCQWWHGCHDTCAVQAGPGLLPVKVTVNSHVTLQALSVKFAWVLCLYSTGCLQLADTCSDTGTVFASKMCVPVMLVVALVVFLHVGAVCY